MTMPTTRIAPFILLFLTTALAAQPKQTSLPGLLEPYVTNVVKLTPMQRKQLFAGEPVTQMLEADPSHEVSVFGAIWVKAPIDRYLAAVHDIEQFEKGENFRVTKKVSDPPKIEDFALFRLPPDDLKDLRSCHVHDCELKLSENSINRLRKEI